MMENRIFGLRELLSEVRYVVEENFPRQVWVRGEILGVSLARNGHCYLTLVENNAATGVREAEVRATIWNRTFQLVSARFQAETGKQFETGMNILALASVQYSEQYGLSLNITDVDPSFTIGNAELERKRTIERLEKEGVMDMNAQLQLPALPRRLAVISSAAAAGYGDFMEHLHHNQYGFKFYSELFTAPMQGADAPEGIVAAMDAVAGRQEEFDAVLILRGGGSATDLACFDNYSLAVNIAQFPLPVLTAIGHERDYHIADMVAYDHTKTPTALADYFVQIFVEESQCLASLAARVSLAVRGKIGEKSALTERLAERIKSAVRLKTEGQKALIDKDVERMRSALRLRLAVQGQKIDLLESRLRLLSPASILEKGYALALKDGRRISSAASLSPGDRLVLVLKDGNIDVEVR